ncbi:MAG: bifunctional diaminohydroxyphosphoribosylaminopyrimidine deaminase/5-amino-6-(5-phosphoribosylamino)uracil reductase RibD [Nitrospirales bacterium]
MKRTKSDTEYMARALRLAAKGRGLTSPNPMVGAVIVQGSRVVGEGYHRRAGGPHAEVVALRSAGTRAHGATLYVNLEPCCHTHKRTPPCVPAIKSGGLRRVVISMRDPNPQVNGRGIRSLRNTGIDVAVGCLRNKAERLNETYCYRMRTGRPFVVLKAAMTLDGKIATAGGASQWITGQAARQHVHRVRSQMDAIMVGIETVLRDDPQLTVRLPVQSSNRPGLRQPMRVILDSRLRLPLTARVLGQAGQASIVVATTAKAPRHRVERLRSLGVTVLVLPAQNGRVSLGACLARLGRMGINSLLIEGGSELNATALRLSLVNRVMLYVAPRLLGGNDAKGLIGGRSPRSLAGAVPLADIRVQRFGDDLFIEGNCLPVRSLTSR